MATKPWQSQKNGGNNIPEPYLRRFALQDNTTPLAPGKLPPDLERFLEDV